MSGGPKVRAKRQSSRDGRRVRAKTLTSSRTGRAVRKNKLSGKAAGGAR